MPKTRIRGSVTTLAVLLVAMTALAGAQFPTPQALAQETALRVNVAIWISDQGTAELCVDLRDRAMRETRQCPERRQLTIARAPEGRWLRSGDLQIGPEVSIYARANLSEGRLRYGLGVRTEGVARGLRAADWSIDLDTTAVNQWITSSMVTVRLPAAPHPELWPPESGIVPGAHRLEEGKPAPDFLLPALGEDEDTLVSLSSARSGGERLTLIVFWSSWAPFVDETLSVLAELAAREDDVFVIGVNVYEVEQDTAEDFIERHGTLLLHLVDESGSVARHYRVDGLPEIFVIDAEGVYRGVIRGAAPLTRILGVITGVE